MNFSNIGRNASQHMRRKVAATNFGRFLRRSYRSIQMTDGGWGVILLYHRIATPELDPQLLCVSPEHFREHLEVLIKSYHPVRLREMSAAVRCGNIPPWSVAITFDDGYADNFHTAVPILREYGIGGTVFVTGQTLDGKDFFYDVLEEVLLRNPALPNVLKFSEYGADKNWKLGEWAVWPMEPDPSYWGWHIGMKADPTPRHRAYREIFTWLRGEAPEVRDSVLKKLIDLTGPGWNRLTQARGMRREDVFAARQDGTLEIGAHTVSHPTLCELTPREQEREIVEAKGMLEKAVGQPVTSFAYPFGTSWDVGPETLQIVESAGFEQACANMPGTVTSKSNIQWLPRFLVRDWSGEQFAENLEGFFSPLKISPPLGRN